jgi:hypothetical protein
MSIYDDTFRCINVLEIINGIPSQIETFPIFEEQLSQDVVDAAEEFFMKLIIKNEGDLSEERKEYYLDEAYYCDKNGYELYIIWSN